MMRSLAVTLIAFAATLMGCSHQNPLVGTYISTGHDDGTAMVQIDSVRDNEVRGTFVLVTLAEAGRVDAARRPMSGTIENGALNLTLETGNSLGLITGAVVPNGLELTLMGNGESIRLAFERRNAAEFDRIVSELRVQSAQIRQDNEAAVLETQRTQRRSQIQRQIDTHSDALLADAQTITAKAREVDNVVAGYRRIASRAGQLRAAAQGVDARSDEGSYRLGDINYRREANRDMAATAHGDVQNYWRTIDGRRQANLTRAGQFMADCQSDPRLSCSRLSSAVSSYGQSISALRTAVDRENAAFEAERQRF